MAALAMKPSTGLTYFSLSMSISGDQLVTANGLFSFIKKHYYKRPGILFLYGITCFTQNII